MSSESAWLSRRLLLGIVHRETDLLCHVVEPAVDLHRHYRPQFETTSLLASDMRAAPGAGHARRST
jgi:hypothetical protein